jgi:hypothetical protein
MPSIPLPSRPPKFSSNLLRRTGEAIGRRSRASLAPLRIRYCQRLYWARPRRRCLRGSFSARLRRSYSASYSQAA